MGQVSLKDSSKKNWTIDDLHSGKHENIELGCFMRIADATETMAKCYTNLTSENNALRDRVLYWQAEAERLKKVNRSLRNQLTRAKNKLNAAFCEPVTH